MINKNKLKNILQDFNNILKDEIFKDEIDSSLFETYINFDSDYFIQVIITHSYIKTDIEESSEMIDYKLVMFEDENRIDITNLLDVDNDDIIIDLYNEFC